MALVRIITRIHCSFLVSTNLTTDWTPPSSGFRPLLGEVMQTRRSDASPDSKTMQRDDLRPTISTPQWRTMADQLPTTWFMVIPINPIRVSWGFCKNSYPQYISITCTQQFSMLVLFGLLGWKCVNLPYWVFPFHLLGLKLNCPKKEKRCKIRSFKRYTLVSSKSLSFGDGIPKVKEVIYPIEVVECSKKRTDGAYKIHGL